MEGLVESIVYLFTGGVVTRKIKSELNKTEHRG